MIPLQPRDPNASPAKPARENDASKSKKRKQDELSIPMVDLVDAETPNNGEGNIHYDIDCQQLRNRITKLLESGDMTVTEFQRKLNIDWGLLGRFMELQGTWSGLNSQTYKSACQFFKERDRAGVKVLRPNKKVKSDDPDTYDVSGIRLDGEEDEAVPIYDTCRDMRNKINAHIRNSTMSQTELGRKIGEQFPVPGKIQGTQIKRFLSYTGPLQGCESAVYYGSYVYFEKLRIKQGGKETKKRQEVRSAHPNGIERYDQNRHGGWWCTTETFPRIDSHGVLRFY